MIVFTVDFILKLWSTHHNMPCSMVHYSLSFKLAKNSYKINRLIFFRFSCNVFFAFKFAFNGFYVEKWNFRKKEFMQPTKKAWEKRKKWKTINENKKKIIKNCLHFNLCVRGCLCECGFRCRMHSKKMKNE